MRALLLPRFVLCVSFSLPGCRFVTQGTSHSDFHAPDDAILGENKRLLTYKRETKEETLTLYILSHYLYIERGFYFYFSGGAAENADSNQVG